VRSLRRVDRLYDLPDIEEIFEDDSMFLAFREYLYRQFANENLTFWIETELYRHIDSESARKERSKEIWDKFCTPESPMPVNIDFNARKAIQNALPSSGSTIYRDAERVTWKVLKNEWFPEFCASDVFHELNEGDGVEHKRSGTTRERGNTIDMYHNLVQTKTKVEKAGRDFVKEINEEPEHWGKKPTDVPKIKAPPISPKVAKENPWESPRESPKEKKESPKERAKDSPRDKQRDSPRDNGEEKKSSKSKDKEQQKDKEPKDKERRHKERSAEKAGEHAEVKDKEHQKEKSREHKHKDKSHDKHKDKASQE
jgi:hypothetical protein